MVDPLGLVGSQHAAPINRTGAPAGPGAASNDPSAPTFKDMLMKELGEVNRLQSDVREAIEDLQTGKRNDIESVIAAKQKADTAFRALLAVRNQVLQAYDELKQIRV